MEEEEKRKLFIGSSSEGLKVANQVKDILWTACGSWLEIVLWDEKVFSYNRSFPDSIVRASRRFDYGILVATNDDLTLIRRFLRLTLRDNVVFEMGLFLGSLGLTRAFFLADINCKLPSDYNGINIPKFSSKKVTLENLKEVITYLESTKKTFAPKAIPSAALAMGYFDNFMHPFIKSRIPYGAFTSQIILPKYLPSVDIKDIIDSYKEKNPSDEISIYNNNTRPIINRLSSNPSIYWDVPTTLSTLNKIINLIIPDQEIELIPEKKSWIEYELRNFIGTLGVLAEGKIGDNKLQFIWF